MQVTQPPLVFEAEALGRPMNRDNLFELLSGFSRAKKLQPVWGTGLLYVAHNELKHFGTAEQATQSLEELEIIASSANEPIDAAIERLIVSRRGHQLCRLIVEINDVQTEQYPEGGQLLGEKIATTSALAPDQVPKSLTDLGSIVHPITIGVAPDSELGALRYIARHLFEETGISQNIQLSGLGPINAPITA